MSVLSFGGNGKTVTKAEKWPSAFRSETVRDTQMYSIHFFNSNYPLTHFRDRFENHESNRIQSYTFLIQYYS